MYGDFYNKGTGNNGNGGGEPQRQGGMEPRQDEAQGSFPHPAAQGSFPHPTAQGSFPHPAAQDITPGRICPEASRPVHAQGMPGQPTPIQPIPGQPAPIQGMPGQSAPIQGMPGQPAPIQPMPGQPAPIQRMPGQSAPIKVSAVKKPVSPMLERIRSHFLIYWLGAALYGVLFALCLYPGFWGISVSLLSFGTMAALLGVFRHLSIPVKKSVAFYFTAWAALSVSSWLTGSETLIFFNTCGMFLLFLTVLFTHFCRTSQWGPGKYFCQMLLAPFVSLGFIGYIGNSLSAYFGRREKGKSAKAKYIWLGIAISIPLLVILVSLLVSADAVFRELFEELFKVIGVPEHPFYLALLFFAGFAGSYCLLAYFASGEIDDTVKERKRWEPVVAVTFLSVITAVYLIFSVIQISYLFVGGFRLPEGYTYASYAREGFFQLLFVCIINLCIILICISRFRAHAALKAVLTIFSSCTFIMIASSAMRMLLYIQTYQLTFLRVLVLWALALITVLLAGCIVTIYYNAFPLFQYGIVAVTLFYVVFSLARPDYHIARYNLSHYEDADLKYILLSLSSDAIPALEEAGVLERRDWEKEGKDEYWSYSGRVARINNRLEDMRETYREMGIRDFNFSHELAGRILERRLPVTEEP